MPPLSLTWTWRRFEQLSAEDVYDLLVLRSRVFVVEQQCVFLDPDDHDRSAWHLLVRKPASGHDRPVLVAYLRCIDAGVRYAEPSIGRVVVDETFRHDGCGRALMVEGIARTHHAWPRADIMIGAQQRLERFYASLGFRTEGMPYDEDGIDHVTMRLAAA